MANEFAAFDAAIAEAQRNQPVTTEELRYLANKYPVGDTPGTFKTPILGDKTPKELKALGLLLSDVQKHDATVDKYRKDYQARNQAKEELEAEKQGPNREFTWMNGGELYEELPPTEWLFKGLWPLGSYGALGADKKSLKTYFLIAAALAQASGKKLLGYWEVPNPGPVLYLSGEGGFRATQRRVQRIAKAMGIDLREIPFYLTCNAAPLDSISFITNVNEMIEKVKPTLVILDPLYAYHPDSVQSSDVYSRGAMLRRLTTLIRGGEAGHSNTSLIIADHFNETGGGFGLQRFSGVGVAAWADSWLLMRHQNPVTADQLELSQFRLYLEAGSRQEGGGAFDIEWDLGVYDPVTEAYSKDITFTVAKHGELPASPRGKGSARTVEMDIEDFLTKFPDKSQNAIVNNIEGYRRQTVIDALNQMANAGYVEKRPNGSAILHRMAKETEDNDSNTEGLTF